jgi:hypothetical protein
MPATPTRPASCWTALPASEPDSSALCRSAPFVATARRSTSRPPPVPRSQAHVELDDPMRQQRDGAGVAGVSLPVHVGRHRARRRGDLAGAERLVPLVKELPEGVGGSSRRLAVDDTVLHVRVQPVVAVRRRGEPTRGGLLHDRPHDAQRDRVRGGIDVGRPGGRGCGSRPARMPRTRCRRRRGRWQRSSPTQPRAELVGNAFRPSPAGAELLAAAGDELDVVDEPPPVNTRTTTTTIAITTAAPEPVHTMTRRRRVAFCARRPLPPAPRPHSWGRRKPVLSMRRHDCHGSVGGSRTGALAVCQTPIRSATGR